ncbi:hypothetical protein [Spirulina major]|uniref:hypothetical protein n=1 Tax=Spirulina major TaxID=270636 RepID=UPI0009331238|nr:hypothetical protein [Spirulina major]
MKPQTIALFTATLLLVIGSNCLNPNQSEATLSNAIATETLDLRRSDFGSGGDPRLLALLYEASIVDVATKRGEFNTALILNIVRALD